MHMYMNVSGYVRTRAVDVGVHIDACLYGQQARTKHKYFNFSQMC